MRFFAAIPYIPIDFNIGIRAAGYLGDNMHEPNVELGVTRLIAATAHVDNFASLAAIRREALPHEGHLLLRISFHHARRLAIASRSRPLCSPSRFNASYRPPADRHTMPHTRRATPQKSIVKYAPGRKNRVRRVHL